MPNYRVGGSGGFYFIDNDNNLFLFHNDEVVGPAPLAGLYELENGGGAPSPPPARRLLSLLIAWSGGQQSQARQRRRRLQQEEDSLTIVSTDTDGAVVWIVLGNG